MEKRKENKNRREGNRSVKKKTNKRIKSKTRNEKGRKSICIIIIEWLQDSTSIEPKKLQTHSSMIPRWSCIWVIKMVFSLDEFSLSRLDLLETLPMQHQFELAIKDRIIMQWLASFLKQCYQFLIRFVIYL